MKPSTEISLVTNIATGLIKKIPPRFIVSLCGLLLMATCISGHGKLSHRNGFSKIPVPVIEDCVRAKNLNVVKNAYGGYNVIAEEGEVEYELLNQYALRNDTGF
ncbi:MAG: hypothetical protein JWO06_804 [Bacteroidota bacterium]|nr:hypothetical protein [Bacteroidota bacterium]